MKLEKLEWQRENPSRWDADKMRIIGGQPAGIFELGELRQGEPVPGEWWRASRDGITVGFAWMDRTWDGAEILLAVDPAQQKTGVGAFMLDRLEREAAARGLNQLYNVVRPSHPDAPGVSTWLKEHGFKPTDGGELRRPVRRRAGG